MACPVRPPSVADHHHKTGLWPVAQESRGNLDIDLTVELGRKLGREHAQLAGPAGIFYHHAQIDRPSRQELGQRFAANRPKTGAVHQTQERIVRRLDMPLRIQKDDPIHALMEQAQHVLAHGIGRRICIAGGLNPAQQQPLPRRAEQGGHQVQTALSVTTLM